MAIHRMVTDDAGMPARVFPPATTYAEIARNMLAASLYNMRRVQEGDLQFKTWDEIARDEAIANFYLHGADVAMDAIFGGR